VRTLERDEDRHGNPAHVGPSGQATCRRCGTETGGAATCAACMQAMDELRALAAEARSGIDFWCSDRASDLR